MSQGGSIVPNEPMGVLALGRRSLTYALGGLAYKGVALLALPILARLLSPEELGLLDLAAVLATIVGLVSALGSDQGVAFLEPRTGPEASLWSSALGIVGLIAGLLVVGAIVFGDTIAEWVIGNPRDGSVIIAAALYGSVLALTATALNAIRLHGSPRAYAGATFLIVTFEMAGALAVAWAFETPVTLMILAWAAGALVVVVPLLVKFVPSFGLPRVSTLRRLASFGAPLVPAAIAWLVGDAWIRAMLAQATDLGSLGEYGIAHRIASAVVLAVTGFGVAWQPYIFRSPPGHVHDRAARLLATLVLVLGFAAVVLTAFAPEIVIIVAGEAYSGAGEVVAALTGGGVALGAFVLVAAVVGTSGSTRRIAIAALLGMATQLLLAPMLIPGQGLVGAGFVSLIGYVVGLGVLLVGERRILRGPRGVAALAAAALVAVGLVTANLAQDWSLVWRGLGLGAIGIVAVGTALTLSWRTRSQSGL